MLSSPSDSSRLFEPSLRPVVPADLPSLVALEATCFGTERFHRRQLCSLLGKPETVRGFVIEHDRRIVAYLLMLLRNATRNARLYTLAVLPEMRGQGLAKRLLQAAESAARGAGKSLLSLEIRQENAAARALYESLGFQTARTLEHYYPAEPPHHNGHGLRMTRQLD